MRPSRARFLVAVPAALLLGLAGLLPAAAAPGGPPRGLPAAVPVCPGPAAPDTARCHARIQPQRAGNYASLSPTGLAPATILSVYGFSTSSTAGGGQTIAIVDAFNNPNAEKDLGTFSQQYGLPSCTTANGCFRKVNQTGGNKLPRTDSGWGLEISLDVQWAHAVAPGARILLVAST